MSMVAAELFSWTEGVPRTRSSASRRLRTMLLMLLRLALSSAVRRDSSLCQYCLRILSVFSRFTQNYSLIAMTR